MLSGLVLVVAYFVDELVHYRIYPFGLGSDRAEWRREWLIIVIGVAAAIGIAAFGWAAVKLP